MDTPLNLPRKDVLLGDDDRPTVIVGTRLDDPYFAAIGDRFEQSFAAICGRLLRPDDIAIDIGANIGCTTAILSRLLRSGHIYAIEAAPTVFSALVSTIQANSLVNVSAFNVAIGESNGTARFVEGSAYGHFAPNGATQVDVRAIDDFVKSEMGGRGPDFIKLDIEGFEWAALRGAAETIERFRPLVYMEFNTWCHIAFAEHSPLDFLCWLLDRFPFVWRVVRGAANDLPPVRQDNALAFLHANMTAHGCVDDLVLSPRPIDL